MMVIIVAIRSAGVDWTIVGRVVFIAGLREESPGSIGHDGG